MKELDKKAVERQEEVLKYLTRDMREEETEEIVIIENIGDFVSEARILASISKYRNKSAELL